MRDAVQKLMDEGRQERLAALYDRFAPRLYRFAYALSGDVETARELLQETFLRLWDRGILEPSPAYLFTIARNLALSRLRRRKLERRWIEADDRAAGERAAPNRDDPERELERAELRRHLIGALAALPAPQRMVFLLSEIADLPYEQIAAVLDLPAGTVASRKHAAVSKLRRILERRGLAL